MVGDGVDSKAQNRSRERCDQPAGAQDCGRGGRVGAANSPGSFCGEELMQPLTLGKVAVRCGILALVLFVVVVIALKFGAVPVSLYGLAKDLIGVMIGHSSNISSEYGMIIREIRLPRIALAIFVGASLSVAGTSFQAVLRNPLADPYVLGVSFGAAVGSVLALIIEPHLTLRPEIAAVFTPLGGGIGATLTIAAAPSRWRLHRHLPDETLVASRGTGGSCF